MTDEEMKQYVDEHWKCVVYCKECKHMEWEGHADMFPNDADIADFPNFKANTMYKGMKLGRKYTLEELGL